MSAQLAQAVAATTLIKIGQDGAELSADATGHLAVLDTATNLVHAVNICPKRLTPAGAKKLADKLNAEKYAGIDTWKVPSRHQSFSIVKPGAYMPAADTDFFPDMQSASYWTDEEHPAYSYFIFAVDFLDGYVSDLDRLDKAFCRPVASVPARQ